MRSTHRKSCAYQQNPRDRCTCGLKVVGQPFTHWQAMADDLVMWILVTSVRNYNVANVSVVHQIAVERLTALAEAYDPVVKAKVERELDQQVEGLAAFVAGVSKS